MRNLILVVALAAAVPAFAKGKQGLKDKAALATSAKIPLGDAVSKAAAKGKPFEAELLKKKGKVVWEFEVSASDGGIVEVDVDADSGEVIDSEPKKG
jgi:uncharacterized membrane protein YkoI